MSVKCFESDTCTGRARVTMQTLTLWVVGGWLLRKFFFFDFIYALQPGGLCVSLAVLSTNWPVQYQLLKANVFVGVFIAKGVPLCMRVLRLMGSAQAQ